MTRDPFLDRLPRDPVWGHASGPGVVGVRLHYVRQGQGRPQTRRSRPGDHPPPCGDRWRRHRCANLPPAWGRTVDASFTPSEIKTFRVPDDESEDVREVDLVEQTFNGLIQRVTARNGRSSWADIAALAGEDLNREIEKLRALCEIPVIREGRRKTADPASQGHGSSGSRRSPSIPTRRSSERGSEFRRTRARLLGPVVHRCAARSTVCSAGSNLSWRSSQLWSG